MEAEENDCFEYISSSEVYIKSNNYDEYGHENSSSGNPVKPEPELNLHGDDMGQGTVREPKDLSCHVGGFRNHCETNPLVCVKKKTLRGRKVLNQSAREIIFNVYKFMKKEANTEPRLLKQVLLRVAEATGVNRATIQRILKDHTSAESRRNDNPVTDIDIFVKADIRRIIHDFDNVGQHPTLKTLLPAIRVMLDFKESEFCLRKILKQLKFKYRNSVHNKELLVERNYILKQRVRYIKALQSYRKEERPIFYMGAFHVNSKFTRNFSWSHDTKHLLASPDKYAILIHIGNVNGFVDCPHFIIKCDKNETVCHRSLNYFNFEKWLSEEVIPILPSNSVLVVENSSFHNRQMDPAPNFYSKKEVMIQWLVNNKIPFDDAMLKPELYQLVKLNRRPQKVFKLDLLLGKHGHSVLRLPALHPDLNPVDMIWTVIKNHIDMKNWPSKLNNCIQLVEEKMCETKLDDWCRICVTAYNIADKYMFHDAAVDDIKDKFNVDVRDHSSENYSREDQIGRDISDSENSNVDSCI